MTALTGTETMMGTELLKAENLTKAYAGNATPVLGGVDFAQTEGEFLWWSAPPAAERPRFCAVCPA